MAKGALRESYVLMAEQWEKLAAELAATLKSDPEFEHRQLDECLQVLSPDAAIPPLTLFIH